ncbi:uncharacterized protein DS421_6g192220 [Arachis hypogaea]|nr:uncharacterized protein DS421_6g192220 [Arachis hypogaea]
MERLTTSKRGTQKRGNDVAKGREGCSGGKQTHGRRKHVHGRGKHCRRSFFFGKKDVEVGSEVIRVSDSFCFFLW